MADKKTTNADDAGASQVQEKFDEANSKGYFGSLADETPFENYTLKGVTSGKEPPRFFETRTLSKS